MAMLVYQRVINHYRDPYQIASIMESKKFIFLWLKCSFLDGNCEGNHLEMKCSPKFGSTFWKGFVFLLRHVFLGNMTPPDLFGDSMGDSLPYQGYGGLFCLCFLRTVGLNCEYFAPCKRRSSIATDRCLFLQISSKKDGGTLGRHKTSRETRREMILVLRY